MLTGPLPAVAAAYPDLPREWKIAVTGGAGYLGLAVVRALVARHRVVAVDIVPPDGVEQHPNLTYVRCSVLDRPALTEALRGVDVVFHRAGLHGNLASMRAPLDYYRVNFLGTLNALRGAAAHGVRKFIFDSTEMVYGPTTTSPVTEDEPSRPASLYGATKLACEHAVAMFDRLHGVPTLTFRYARVRDPDKRDVVWRIAEQVARGLPVTLHDDGAAVLDYVDVRDAIRAGLLGAASPVRGEVINVSAGEGMSLRAMVDHIQQCAGRLDSPVLSQRLPTFPPSSETRFGPLVFYLSIAKARRLLGWQPDTTIRASLEATVKRVMKAAP